MPTLRKINPEMANVALPAIAIRYAFVRMTRSKNCFEKTEGTMQRTKQQHAVCAAKSNFNYNKLQAAMCMALSAAVSISTIAWAIKTFS